MRKVRWNIVVSEKLDRAVRIHLAQRGGRKGDLSRFVEEAVLNRLSMEGVVMEKPISG